jgi:hypothetical protein
VRLLRLSVGRGRLDALHQRQPNAVQERLLEAVRQYRILCRLQQSHPGVRDGDAGTKQRLSLGMLCMSAVQSQVSLELICRKLISNSIRLFNVSSMHGKSLPDFPAEQ